MLNIFSFAYGVEGNIIAGDRKSNDDSDAIQPLVVHCGAHATILSGNGHQCRSPKGEEILYQTCSQIGVYDGVYFLFMRDGFVRYGG